MFNIQPLNYISDPELSGRGWRVTRKRTPLRSRSLPCRTRGADTKERHTDRSPEPTVNKTFRNRISKKKDIKTKLQYFFNSFKSYEFMQDCLKPKKYPRFAQLYRNYASTKDKILATSSKRSSCYMSLITLTVTFHIHFMKKKKKKRHLKANRHTTHIRGLAKNSMHEHSQLPVEWSWTAVSDILGLISVT